MTRITVLGNFSGRNTGDNAILGNLLDDVAARHPEAEFIVPTLRASYVREAFAQHKVRALGLMPWNLSLKIFGLPALRAMLATDLVLITDNILFDRQYFNPAFNYLSTIAAIAPLSRRRGIPVLPYNASLGPITTARGARAMQRVLDAAPAAILRDKASATMLAELGLNVPPIVEGADCALNTRQPDPQQMEAILARLGLDGAKKALLGLNINAYIDSWAGGSGGLGRKPFVGLCARAFDRLIEDLDVLPVLFVTQVMDRKIVEELKSAMRHGERAVIVANPDYDYREMAGILGRLELLVAMRTHALILATSSCTPVFNINAYPKSLGYLGTLGLESSSIELDDLNEQALYAGIAAAWARRAETRSALAVPVAREKAKALASVDWIAKALAAA